LSSPASIALSAGFGALIAFSGEPLVFRSVEVSGLVDRSPDRQLRQEQISFDPDRASVVEIFTAAVSPIPRVGESFEDENGLFHRIRIVKPIEGFKLRCICEVSE